MNELEKDSEFKKDFYGQLATLLYQQLPLPDTTETNYNTKGYDSYVEVIASAVSSIGSALGGLANKKALDALARGAQCIYFTIPSTEINIDELLKVG